MTRHEKPIIGLPPSARRIGLNLAKAGKRSKRLSDDQAAMWELLKLSARAYRSLPPPPRSGYPAKSSLPETPSDVSFWSLMRGVLDGRLDIEDAMAEAPRIQPTAQELSIAEAVHDLFRFHALKGKGARVDLMRMLYAWAAGCPAAKLCRRFGISDEPRHRARAHALSDMVNAAGWV